MASPVILHIHESDVQSFIRQGGDVHDILVKVTRKTRAFSIEEAPSRSGRLKRGFSSKHPTQTGPYSAMGRVSNSTRYAVYVHEGVNHSITASPYMLVPMVRGTPHTNNATKGAGQDLFISWKAGGKKRSERNFYRLKEVSGQAANNFMQRGLRRALASERLT